MIDLSEMDVLASSGLLSTQKHPTEELLIHNYTARCQYSRAWTPTLMACRGLITDTTGRIVARPFPKFFNLSEHIEHADALGLPPVNWAQPFVATHKLDGSLGVLYHSKDGPRIATRGSFTSPQSAEGNRIFLEYGYDGYGYRIGWTYLFEIIYPQNRIVVDYGDVRSLVLLDVLDNRTGQGMPYDTIHSEAAGIGCQLAELCDHSADVLASGDVPQIANHEGYVIRFEDGVRVKVKFADYVRLHRLLTGLNERMIWQHLSEGRPLAELLDHVPDEFNAWLSGVVKRLHVAFAEVEAAARTEFAKVDTAWTRKQCAEVFTKLPDLAAVLFALLDGKDIAPLIWKRIKPETAGVFRCDSET